MRHIDYRCLLPKGGTYNKEMGMISFREADLENVEESSFT